MNKLIIFIKNNSFDLSFKNLISKPEFKHSLWMVGGQIAVSFIAFMMTFVLANYVSEGVVGSFRFVLAMYATFSALALVGMGNALMQSAAAGSTGTYNFSVIKKMQYGLFGTIAMLILASYYGLYLEEYRLAQTILMVGLMLPWIEAFSLFGPYLNGVSKFKYTSIFLTVERAVTSGAVILVSFFQPSILAIAVSYFGSRLVVGYILYRLSLLVHPPDTIIDVGALPYAKHMTLMSLLGILAAQLDKFVLFVFFGPVSLAIFWIASVIPQEFGRFFGIVLGTFFPRIVQLDDHHSKLFIKKIFSLIIIIGLCVGLIYALLAKFIFSIFLPVYMNAITMSIVLMLAYAITPYTIVWNYLTARKKIKELYLFSIGEPIILILGYLAFVPIYGMWGIVFTLCLRTICLNCVSAYYLYLK